MLHRLTRKIKSEYYAAEFLAVQKTQKKTWALVNSVFRGRIRKEGLSPEAVGKSLDEVNSFFARAGRELVARSVGEISPSVGLPRAPDCAFEYPDEEGLRRLVMRLKSRKASGRDGIPVRLLKDSFEVLSAPIRAIIRKIIDSSVYPEQLQLGCLRPIHKTGSPDDIVNYRPISLLSSINKIVGKVLPTDGIPRGESSIGRCAIRIPQGMKL